MYRGVDIAPYFIPRLDYTFTVFSEVVGDVIALTDAAAEQLHPKHVVLDHEQNLYGIGFLYNQRKHDYKTLALQFELVSSRISVHKHIHDKQAQDEKSPLWRPYPDIKCVSGSYARDILKKECNVPPSRMVLTGQPQLDQVREKGVSKKTICSKLGLDPKKKIVLYATKFRDNERDIWRQVQQLAEQLDVQVIFKLAPVNDEKHFKSLLGEALNTCITKHFSIPELLGCADALISIRSTAITEALSANVPVIQVDYDRSCALPYEDFEATYATRDIGQLEAALKTVLFDKKARKRLIENGKSFLTQTLFCQDGKAAARVVEVVLGSK
jgi:CDP-glycerol glycerophosphotransferase (TagB/SpsB family)